MKIIMYLRVSTPSPCFTKDYNILHSDKDNITLVFRWRIKLF